jgi:hypothetical protein
MFRHCPMIERTPFACPKQFSGFGIEFPQIEFTVGQHCPQVFEPQRFIAWDLQTLFDPRQAFHEFEEVPAPDGIKFARQFFCIYSLKKIFGTWERLKQNPTVQAPSLIPDRRINDPPILVQHEVVFNIPTSRYCCCWFIFGRIQEYNVYKGVERFYSWYRVYFVFSGSDDKRSPVVLRQGARVNSGTATTRLRPPLPTHLQTEGSSCLALAISASAVLSRTCRFDSPRIHNAVASSG